MYFRLKSLCPTSRISALVLCLLFFGSAAKAASNVLCEVGLNSVSFSAYNPFSAAPADSETGSIQIKCRALGPGASSSVSYVIGLSSGQSPQNTPWRTMRGGPLNETIEYNLYTSAGRSAVWGELAASQGVSGSVTGIPVTGAEVSGTPHTIYARMPPRQRKAPGLYTDLIQITVAY
jgi:spore coat protein U-like protein